MNDKRLQFVYDFIDTILSIIRLLIFSRFKRTIKIACKHEGCIILGNGPSLVQTMNECREKWDDYDLVAVNHMAQSEQYVEYKPSIYILCDPAFWFAFVKGFEFHKERVEKTYQAMLEKTDWPMQLYIPYQAKGVINKQLASNKNISIYYFNKTKFEGFSWLKYIIYNKQWGMVRPQNVLNAALMLMIYSGYKTIYLVGANNDWLRRIWIDEHNNFRNSDIHFYPEEKKETEVCTSSVKLHQILLSQYFCFKNYVDIEEYAQQRQVKILNACLESFIDAFEKKKI